MQQGRVLHPQAPQLQVGATATDERDNRTGVVMDVDSSRVWLRPHGGGREWEAPRTKIRTIPGTETTVEEPT
jgi:hypothetical protein